VATSVLHNVGNVLNSVNVSANLIFDQVKQSRSTDLSRVVALLKDHPSDLSEFMTRDPKGRRVPFYLEQLARHLDHEKTCLVDEVQSLTGNIEHIKDIVAMQQNYSRLAGVTEPANPADLIEDALRMHAGALTRHSVEVHREYPAGIPAIIVDKHKVLQVLVNLVQNAKYACDGSNNPNKLLTVRLAQEDGRVKMSVTDNGVGIPAENLARIFNFGFTTRKNGHGFALHSGANAAKEMGGTLSAHSEGPGRGATFCLELPLRPPSAQ
jgi:C4-dicarboxylate-specific signal transduction histidine kinase